MRHAPSSPPPRSPSPPKRDRAFALLLVLLLVSIVTVLVLELAYQSSLEYMAAANVSDTVSIEYAIDGQFEVGLGLLKYDKKQGEAVDTEYDGWAAAEHRQRADGEVQLAMRVFDEQGKFNITRTFTGNEQQTQKAKEILTRIIDLFREDLQGEVLKGGDVDMGAAQDLADKIVRYLKRDGATGQVPKPKTTPANIPLLLDEITFADPKFLPALLVDMRVGEKVAPGLHRFLTVHGTGRVNVNTAPLVVLKALFANASDRDYAQAIIDRRRGEADTSTGSVAAMGAAAAATQGNGTSGGNPFSDVNTQLIDGSVQGLTAEVLQKNGIVPAEDLDVKSDYFSFRIQGATTRTQRDELYAVERVKTDGFRFLLHQERTDPLIDVEGDVPAGDNEGLSR
jgi:general secretion pathway protein K